ncbi:diadenylate cyclase CdaA [Pseudopedobacter beijingensis]|uniref:Diadenylate cyclase n=1 Tax=Pseudopedobacter beijingensis TaxID=1207056 RepID=A0ABW4I9L0_9SPHI
MEFLDFSFLKMTVIDVVDILLVAIIIYYIYNLIRGTIAVNIFIGFILIYVLYFVASKMLHMKLLSGILNSFVSVGLIALIIVFQQEFRRFLLSIGKNISLRNKLWMKLVFGKEEVEKNNLAKIKPIIDACKSMKQTRTGALIVFSKYFDQDVFGNTGEFVDARISKRLIESIFQKHSPIHDGAVVIAENRIKTAGCILPLTENDKLPPQFGLRHRAGIGITETSECTALIVSEETGEISYAQQGKVKMNISFTELERLLNKDF